MTENRFSFIDDTFTTYDELEKALREAGLESSQLVIGIDFTKSNTWNGGPPFYADKNLHAITNSPNPYQQVLNIMCKTLEPFDDDNLIPAYGFGDVTTQDRSVFSIAMNQQGQDIRCDKLSGVLNSYSNIASKVKMSGPTTFAPIIRKTIDIVKCEKNRYHILLIICDGEISEDNMEETITAIAEASKYPLSIICVGVGKGPWDTMEKFDNQLPKRKFDNFQFVNFHKVMSQCNGSETEFARNALMEIPTQLKYIKKNHLEGQS
jgi:E3 ubiquitin-protein ligase RGLG